MILKYESGVLKSYLMKVVMDSLMTDYHVLLSLGRHGSN